MRYLNLEDRAQPYTIEFRPKEGHLWAARDVECTSESIQEHLAYQEANRNGSSGSV